MSVAHHVLYALSPPPLSDMSVVVTLCRVGNDDKNECLHGGRLRRFCQCCLSAVGGGLRAVEPQRRGLCCPSPVHLRARVAPTTPLIRSLGAEVMAPGQCVLELSTVQGPRPGPHAAQEVGAQLPPLSVRLRVQLPEELPREALGSLQTLWLSGQQNVD